MAQTISDANASGQYGGMLGGAGSGGTYAGGVGNASPYQPSADNQTSQTASTTGNGAVINNSASAKTAMGGGSGGGGSGGGGSGGGAGGYSLGASMADSTTQSLGFSGSLGSNRVSGAVFGDFNTASGGGTATQGISSRTLMILGIVGAVVAGLVALVYFGRRR